MNGIVVSLTLCLMNPAPVAEGGQEPRACYELATFDTRVECRITAQRVKVHVSGARLLCLPRELSPDEKIQMARGGQ